MTLENVFVTKVTHTWCSQSLYFRLLHEYVDTTPALHGRTFLIESDGYISKVYSYQDFKDYMKVDRMDCVWRVLGFCSFSYNIQCLINGDQPLQSKWILLQKYNRKTIDRLCHTTAPMPIHLYVLNAQVTYCSYLKIKSQRPNQMLILIMGQQQCCAFLQSVFHQNVWFLSEMLSNGLAITFLQ